MFENESSAHAYMVLYFKSVLKKFKFFFLFLFFKINIFVIFLYYLNVLLKKIKNKKYYFNIFSNKKIF